MEFEIKAGGKFEAATPTEVRNITQSMWQQYFEERARGIKHMRFVDQGFVANNSILIHDPLQMGPRPGFVWAVQRINVEGLTGSDFVLAYRDPAPLAGPGSYSGNLYGQISGNAPLHIGSKGIILHPGEFLAIFGTGLTTTDGTQITVNGEVIEAPAFKLNELL